MYETEKTNNNTKESNSEMFNLYDYMKTKNLNLFESHMVDREQDCNGEREICNTLLDNIKEEQIIVEKMIEYYVPVSRDYKFPNPCDILPKTHEFPRRKGDSPYLSRSSTSIGFSNSRMYPDDCKYVGSSTSKHSIKLIRSKSVTQLKSSYPECLINQNPSEQSNHAIKKYTKTFLNSELTLQELNQQNILAQELLQKYFKEEVPPNKTANKSKQDNGEVSVNKQEEKNSMQTVSSLLRHYHSDKNEQVCLKPSDEYIFLNDKSKKDLNTKNSSIKFVRPFKYHKKHWDSSSNLNVVLPFQFDGSSRKRTRVEFESNVALKQDSSTDTSLKTENVQFLATETKRTRKSDSQQNQVLYKTDSKNFENTYSSEELQAFMPERYMSLRNLYGCDYIKDMQEQVNKPRYNFQTLPNKKSKSGELVVKFFDSGSHIKVTDDDYKKWLKEKDFIKYTDLTNSSVSSVTFRSISQKIVNYSVAPTSKSIKRRSRPHIMDKNHQIGFNKLTESRTRPTLTTSLENCKFIDIEYNNLYQLFLYEHIVISNVINFCCSFGATRVRKLRVVDRVYQFLFLLLCYYVLSLINSKVFDEEDENWF